MFQQSLGWGSRVWQGRAREGRDVPALVHSRAPSSFVWPWPTPSPHTHRRVWVGVLFLVPGQGFGIHTELQLQRVLRFSVVLLRGAGL